MKITAHPTNNDELAAPRGVPASECTPAPITRYFYVNPGRYAVRTYWRPTDEERKAISTGKDVFLEVWGETMAPAVLGVDGVVYETPPQPPAGEAP